jgi:putative endonuclease
MFTWLKRRRSGPAHLRTGEWGEDVAAKALKKKGYKLLGRRVRVGRRDELDIVARKGETLVFVEVKTRRSEALARPASAVNRSKRHALSRAACRYLRKLKHPSVYVRFDIVEVIGTEEDGEPTVRHLENAFALDPRCRLPY